MDELSYLINKTIGHELTVEGFKADPEAAHAKREELVIICKSQSEFITYLLKLVEELSGV